MTDKRKWEKKCYCPNDSYECTGVPALLHCYGRLQRERSTIKSRGIYFTHTNSKFIRESVIISVKLLHWKCDKLIHLPSGTEYAQFYKNISQGAPAHGCVLLKLQSHYEVLISNFAWFVSIHNYLNESCKKSFL